MFPSNSSQIPFAAEICGANNSRKRGSTRSYEILEPEVSSGVYPSSPPPKQQDYQKRPRRKMRDLSDTLPCKVRDPSSRERKKATISRPTKKRQGDVLRGGLSKDSPKSRLTVSWELFPGIRERFVANYFSWQLWPGHNSGLFKKGKASEKVKIGCWHPNYASAFACD